MRRPGACALRRLGIIGAAAISGVGAASLSQVSAATLPVQLASSVRSPHRPTTVLVHGLDSSKETWTGVLDELTASGYPAFALDLRGHGESPMGDPARFSPTALAEDVIAAVRAHGVVSDCVLVGHSMGGRIAMRAAAIDAASVTPLFRSVIVEDMDIRPRASSSPPESELSEAALAELQKFATESGRRFPDWPHARAALLRWYDGDAGRVDGWKGKRARELPGGEWWTDINPYAQRLARDRVLATDDGASAWDSLVVAPVEVHLWYADTPGTVCEVSGPGGIEDMARRLPSANVRFFEGAGHSIHNSAREEFMTSLYAVIDARSC